MADCKKHFGFTSTMDHEGKSNGNGLQDWIVIIGCVVVGSKIRTQTGWVMAFKKNNREQERGCLRFWIGSKELS